MAGRRWSTWCTRTAVAALALALLPSVPASAVSRQQIASGKTLSGVVGTGGQNAVNAFGSWRGKAAEAVTAYTGTSTWSSITDVTVQGLTKYWDGSSVHVVWSVPLLPLQEPATLQAAAAGSYNSKYASVAQQLVAGGDGDATIRLGWEMTGDWYTWNGRKDPAAYAGAFRQAVTAMRSVSGAHFTFDWNIALGFADPAPMYPGDAYVDFIGADNYDSAWTVPATDHVGSWNHIVNQSWGLSWLASFASSHGKRLSFPEWGLQWRCDGHGGGDDPYFVQEFRAWMASHDVAYENYFNVDENSCTKSAMTTGTFPQAAAAYQKSFAATVVTPPASPPPATGALDLTRLRVSTSASRSNGVMLFGAKVSGSCYVWLTDATGTTQVRFYLDRPTSQGPTHAETSAPWDLVGGSAPAATPLVTSTLAGGSHQLTVQATLSNGVVQSATVSFTVG